VILKDKRGGHEIKIFLFYTCNGFLRDCSKHAFFFGGVVMIRTVHQLFLVFSATRASSLKAEIQSRIVSMCYVIESNVIKT
jgi:hypothetical protein